MILDRHLRPILNRQIPLLLGARRRNSARTNRLEQLAQPQPDAARRSRHEDPVPLLHGMRLADERERSEGLEEGGSRILTADAVRDGDCVVGTYGCVLGVGGLAHVDYAGAGGEVGGGVGADGGDGAAGFAAEDVGEGGDGVEAGAEVAVWGL